MILTGYLGDAEKITRAVEYLTSGDSGFVTGSTLIINGGQPIA